MSPQLETLYTHGNTKLRHTGAVDVAFDALQRPASPVTTPFTRTPASCLLLAVSGWTPLLQA